MNESYDYKHRIIKFRKRDLHIYYLSSLSNDILISRVIEGIETNKKKDLSDCLNAGDVTVLSVLQKEDIDYAVMSGNMAIYDKDLVYILDTKKYPNRSIEQPDAEKSIRGAKDGFNESILNNTGLIRRRIRSENLCFHLEKAGTDNPIDIAVVYLKHSVKQNVLDEIIERIRSIKAKNLIMSERALEELLLDQSYHPYPLVRYSERPDIVSSHILRGKIAIIADTSSSVMMLPASLFDLLEDVEEHRQLPVIGTCIRIVRMIAVFLSLYLVPLYALSLSYLSWDYNLFIQIIILELAIELLRIATIHTPDSISNAMGLIAALLLGEYAIELGFFTKDILLFCSISAICTFAVPNYELSLTHKYLRLLMLVIIMFFNIYGFIIYNIIYILYMMNLKTLNQHYLYPLYPFNYKEFIEYMVRKPKKQ